MKDFYFLWMSQLTTSNARMDVSWALVQREARNFGSGELTGQTFQIFETDFSGVGAMPNRVIHPPINPVRREIMSVGQDAAVIAEGLVSTPVKDLKAY